ncbi:hypothetical protein [Sediminitomix flava]|uniref:Tetratricopeptide repeat protein n=1 Tax=Sediminitomix flava TaxID=379075 RepID=A0A315ZHZ6_SEDFL|nr:hypothetical protein [Sediminitomix flava]PWJ44730.1 hypothetical protein BC781_1011101 [Sediminitomix flava]
MKKTIITLAALTTLSISAFASNDLYDSKTEKYENLRMEVKNATNSDWSTPFKAAQVCLRDQKNISEAYTWIEQSLKVKETSENLELKGDYLALHGLDEMAFEHYQKALSLKIAKGQNDFEAIQTKILALKK